MMQLAAIRALRLNYRRRGLFPWLRGHQRCLRCHHGKGRVPLGVTSGLIGLTADEASFTARACPRCDGSKAVRGYQRILTDPEKVIQEQHALAEGAFA